MTVKLAIASITLVAGGVNTSCAEQTQTRTQKRLAAELQEQLRLAAKVGIPTTVEEFKAGIPKVKPEENAAPIYASIGYKESRTLRDAGNLAPHLIWSPNEKLKAQARTILTNGAKVMAKADAAVKLPTSVFDRDYSLGVALLMPELMMMKDITKTFTMRAALAAAEGDHVAALAEVANAFTVARHLHEEPILLGYLVSSVCEAIALNSLANLAMKYREVPLYRKELETAIAAIKPRSTKSLHRFDLIEILSTIELCKTKEGRVKIGLGEDEVATLPEFITKHQSPEAAMVLIVKAIRENWQALDAPLFLREEKITLAQINLFKGLVSFPTAARVIEGLGAGGVNLSTFEEDAKARQLVYRAFLRVLDEPEVPKKIKTSDLLSPFDGKPASYKTVNGRVVIEVGKGAFGEFSVRMGAGPPTKPFESSKP